MDIALLALAALAAVDVDAQRLLVELDPATGSAQIESYLTVEGDGTLLVRLNKMVSVEAVTVIPDDGPPALAQHRRRPDGAHAAIDVVEISVPERTVRVNVSGRAQFRSDVAAGEAPGAIHNFSVSAHVGEEGIFLSDDSAWHPLPLGADGQPLLHALAVEVKPMPGWVIVASGQPAGGGAIDEPRWSWRGTRPMEAVAIAGNRHAVHGVVHETEHGPVEVVMHVSEAHRDLAPMFVEAACGYLDLYVPRLGAFPFPRFTIVENFFSSGFAMPGFTVLGPSVVGMAPRSLEPGYLDHELLHNWWGNGVYVDAREGNWCEALTSYGANYWRRTVDGGEEAALAYRRSILMKLSTDPEELDDGRLADFGSADPAAGGTGRFVGYDKGAFVFMMLEQAIGATAALPAARRPGDDDPTPVDRTRMWAAMRRFADENLGRRATWTDLRRAFEKSSDVPLVEFFDQWVYRHTVPVTPSSGDDRSFSRFLGQYALPRLAPLLEIPGDRSWIELDPEFVCYRVLPPGQIIPTLAGTLGRGGVRLVTEEERPEVAEFRPRIESAPDGENLFLIGPAAAAADAEFLARAADTITITEEAFTVGGERYADSDHAVLHTMPHPDRPGRFITVFCANGAAGWSRLRLATFYTRDSTIVWKQDEVVARRLFEPSRRLETR